MKLLKKALILGAFPFLLTSCGTESVCGVYSFTMGKDNGTHIRAAIELLDTKLEGRNENEFRFTADLGGTTDNIPPYIADLIRDGIKGYYRVSDKTTERGERIYLGTTLSALELYVESEGITIPEQVKELLKDYSIPDDLVEKIISAYLIDGKINLEVPVSINDLLMQLAWYGKYISITNLSIYDLPTNVVGSHPTAEDIERYNRDYEEIFCQNKVHMVTDGTTVEIGALKNEYVYALTTDKTVNALKTYYEMIEGKFKAVSHQRLAGIADLAAENKYYERNNELHFIPNSSYKANHQAGAYATDLEVRVYDLASVGLTKKFRLSTQSPYLTENIDKTLVTSLMGEGIGGEFAMEWKDLFVCNEYVPFRDFNILSLTLKKEVPKH